MLTESASQALAILRDPSQFQWYVVPLLLIVIYIYNVEFGKKNWSIFFAGLACGEWIGSMKSGTHLFFTSPSMHQYGEPRV